MFNYPELKIRPMNGKVEIIHRSVREDWVSHDGWRLWIYSKLFGSNITYNYTVNIA